MEWQTLGLRQARKWGWVARKQIVELKDEFSMPDADPLLYRFEVDDATAFTRLWKGELTMVRADLRVRRPRGQLRAAERAARVSGG